jgi:flagellar biosynthesis/type III secretory pathway protein FliH
MPKSRFSAAIYLIVVFLSGALVGGLSYRLYAVSPVSAKLSPEDMRHRYIEAIREKLKLDNEQVQQVNQILDDTRARYNEIRNKMRTEGQAINNRQVEQIEAILHDDQKSLYAAFRAERERMREQMREKQPRKE